MSRIGKKPITVPSGVDVTINGVHVVGEGPEGDPRARRARGHHDRPRGRRARRRPVPTTSVRTARCTASPARSSPTWSSACPKGSAGTSRSSASATAPSRRARRRSSSRSASPTRCRSTHPTGITFEVPAPTRITVRGYRQAARRPGRRRHPQDPQARALQGQGHPLFGRARAAQGREVGEVTRQRVRGALTMTLHKGRRAATAPPGAQEGARDRRSGRASRCSGRTSTSTRR